MLTDFIILSTIITTAIACPPAPYDPPAKLIATFPKPYEGQVKFDVTHEMLKVEGAVSGLPPNSELGAHIHQFGDLGNGCNNAGGHYNPHNVNHGGPDTDVRHPGDFGNIKTDEKGTAHISLSIPNPKVESNSAFLGRAMVIHNGTDDLGRGGDEGSRTTGNSGGRLTCAVLGLANTA